jgi:exopolysaccharide production protein ExoQ
MPASLATLLTIICVFALFRIDTARQGKTSAALWLPVLWVAIAGTRFLSQWINIGKFAGADLQSVQDGSTIDALYFALLIFVGLVVLSRRQIVISELVRNNKWLALFFIYSFLSVAWSDFPFIALKRYIKALGHPVMALIILSDPNPKLALRTVLKRCAYLMVPVSILLIKYYPWIGRSFDSWSGAAVNNGAMLTKNELGAGCMFLGIFFFWNLLTAKNIKNSSARHWELLISATFLFLISWLLFMSSSATSQGCFLIGAVTVLALGINGVRDRFTAILIVTILLAYGAQLFFNIYTLALEMLGRDPTLTDRTEVWADALALVKNPILGAGFESFWLGHRLEIMWQKWWWRPNQAHNGYIETYLNLGIIGLIILVGIVVSTFRSATKQLVTDFDLGRLRLALLAALLFYSYTEAAFKGVALIWTAFHIIAINYPVRPDNLQPEAEEEAA